MTSPDPARYAEGHLDPATRRALTPPSPTPADWKRVSDAIALRVLPRSQPTKPWRRRVSLLATLAASVLALIWIVRVSTSGPERTKPELALVNPPTTLTPLVRPELTDPLAEFAVLPIATDQEVRIATVRGEWGNTVVVGDVPTGELKLATADDIAVERLPTGMDSAPDFGDLPMVFSLRARRASE